ncbi:MAG TPA: hypothetical protein PLH57_03195 [Oligoflexia bacterium]|nr:hypothetical protein [Oligoflexia bacterium]
MSQENPNILDLTLPQTLYELAIDDHEIYGPAGAKLIADLRERAFEADYTHLYFRDPMRPGIVWFMALGSSGSLPTRGKLDYCRKITDKVFPGFLAKVDSDSDDNIMTQIPPLTTGVSGFELATALEYLVFVYPSMVRAWAALVFTYGEMLGMREAAETVRNECNTLCPYAQVVAYLTTSVATEV